MCTANHQQLATGGSHAESVMHRVAGRNHSRHTHSLLSSPRRRRRRPTPLPPACAPAQERSCRVSQQDHMRIIALFCSCNILQRASQALPARLCALHPGGVCQIAGLDLGNQQGTNQRSLQPLVLSLQCSSSRQQMSRQRDGASAAWIPIGLMTSWSAVQSLIYWPHFRDTVQPIGKGGDGSQQATGSQLSAPGAVCH